MENTALLWPRATWGVAPADAEIAFVALHGRGGAPQDMLHLCKRIDVPRTCCVAPSAPAGSWYPQGFMNPLTDNEPDLSAALGCIDELVRDYLLQGIPAERIALLGFSQGACLAAEYALRHPRRYRALLIFTGGAVGPVGTQWRDEGSLLGTPALISGSREDAWVPASRMQLTAQLLRERGARVEELYYATESHLVSDGEVQRARGLLDSRMAR